MTCKRARLAALREAELGARGSLMCAQAPPGLENGAKSTEAELRNTTCKRASLAALREAEPGA